VAIDNPTVTKSGGTSASDNYSFYGINSGIMVKGGGTATITGGTVTTSAAGANGVFSYGANSGSTNAAGDGTTVNISDTVITTTGNGSGGIMTTYGGTTNASNLTVTTSGGSSAPIRTDRGGGWVTVTGGTYTSSGVGSPAIYSTADVDVSGATLVSSKSEGVCIEGTGSIELTDCELTATNSSLNGNATFYDTIMIYQSMSGDANSGTSSFTMTGGTLTSNNGHVFHVTNTTATITISGVTIVNNDSDGILLSVCDDGWSGGSNTATFIADGQTMDGTILVGSDSKLTLKLTDGTVYTGKISGNITNGKGTTVSTSVGTVSVTLDSTSKWYLTGDTYVSSFSGTAANVINNGYTLYVNGSALSGTSDSDDDDDSGDVATGFAVQLTAPENAEIRVYNTQTMTGAADAVIAAGSTGTVYARSSSDGTIDTSGSGQVNFVVVPANGYEVDEVTATGSYKNLKGPDDTGTENAYRITKITAGDVVVNVSVKASENFGDDTGSVAANSFTDVSSNAYYYDAVLWAVENGVTNGTTATTFSPSDDCTRAQIVTFLWRAAGSPEPTITSCAFTDISNNAYYYKAVLWAVENEITAGTSATTFSPDASCTRGQVVTFLYRYVGSPSVTAASTGFTDLKSGAYYYQAVLWAVENGVTKGTSATTFSPDQTCNRAQIVTFLYRAVVSDDTDTDVDSGVGKVTSGPTYFVFSDSGITASGNTANIYSINGTALTLSEAGTYSVSGSCADGSITVKKGTTDVYLILNGLTLTSSDTAPIACNKSTAVTIEAAAGTVNTLTDSTYNNDDNYPDNTNAENAVIKCKDGSQVTLCGNGTVNVIANGKNGVKGGATTETEGESWLTVKELTLNITANVNDGLKSDQELNILSGNITVKAADDGIKSDYVLNIGASGTAGPTINLAESNEGIEAATINVYSGDITVHATDDGMNAANSDLTGYSFSLNIYGGTMYVDAQTGDGLDSNGSLTIAGGTVTVFSAANSDNAPLDCDSTFTLSGGTILAVGSGGMAQTPNNASQRYLSFGAGGIGGMSGPGGGGPGGGGQPGSPGNGGMPGGQGGAVSIAAGDSIVIQDTGGNVIYSAVAIRAASYVFFSSSALVSGQTYTMLVNGASAATATA